MTSPLNRRNQIVFWTFHKEVGHPTDNCHALKQDIKTVIQQGQLLEYIQVSHPAVTPAKNCLNQGPTMPHIINVIFENNDSFSFPPHKWIRFSESNLRDSLPLVIPLYINTYFVHRILVDTGCLSNILYYDTWK